MFMDQMRSAASGFGLGKVGSAGLELTNKAWAHGSAMDFHTKPFHVREKLMLLKGLSLFMFFLHEADRLVFAEILFQECVPRCSSLLGPESCGSMFGLAPPARSLCLVGLVDHPDKLKHPKRGWCLNRNAWSSYVLIICPISSCFHKTIMWVFHHFTQKLKHHKSIFIYIV